MRKTILICCLVVTFTAAGFSQVQDSSKDSTSNLSDHLKILEPLVNKHWVGKLSNPQNGQMMEVSRDFKVIWNGSVVKYSDSLKEINNASEGYFYWDPESKQVAVFIVGSTGTMRNGQVSIENGILTVRGTLNFPDIKFEYKNTFEFRADGKMIDRWFHKASGDWQTGHVIEFTAEDN